MLVILCLIASLTWYVSNLQFDIICVLHPLLGLLIDVIELTFSHFGNLSRAFQSSSAATFVWSDSLMLLFVHIAQSLVVSHVLR